MAGEETEKIRQQGFARAFTARVYGKGSARKNLVLPAVAILVFAGGALAIGALTAHKSAHKNGGASSAASVSKVVAAPARPGTPGKNGKGASWPGPAIPPAAVPGGQSGPGGPGGPAPGSPPWPSGGAPAPAPGTQSAAKAGTQTAAQPRNAAQPAVHASASTAWVVVTGQVNCTSGDAVEGFWIAPAGAKAGWANWKVVGSGPNADYWLSEPPGVAASGYKLSVGCGGTRQSWKTATYTGLVTGTHNSFHCDDRKGTSGYGACTKR